MTISDKIISDKLRGKFGRTVACGAVMAGFVAAAVLSSPAANAEGTSVQTASISNYSGFTFTLVGSEQCHRKADGPGERCIPAGSSILPAPRTIFPGQTATWDTTVSPGYDWRNWVFTMTDPADGTKYDIAYTMSSNGYYYVGSTKSGEHLPFRAWHDSTQGGAEYFVPEQPTTVKIDNAKDPRTAASVMNGLFSEAVDGSVKWTPNEGATPTYKVTNAERATSMISNYSSEPATVVKGSETSKGESTSFGTEITGSVAVKAFGASAKDAASFTADNEWGSSDSVDVDVDSEIEPGHVGWIDKAVTVASLKGHLEFTTPDGVTFDITNVTISKGDLVNPNGNLPSGITYMPDEKPLTGPAGQ